MILAVAFVAFWFLCSQAALLLRARSAHQEPVAEAAVGRGNIQGIDRAAASVLLRHEAISLFGMPAMTMSFPVRRPEMLAGVAVGEAVAFTLRMQDGVMVLTDLKPLGGQDSPQH